MTDWLYGLVTKTPIFVQWILFVVMIVIGFFLLVKGADIFVNSASTLAKALKIPAIVVGLTIVAFGTSAPEASISIIATANGSAGISVGNIIGSNMFNLLIVLGISALFALVVIEKTVVKRDLLVMLLSSYLLVLFAFLFGNGKNRALVWFESLTLFVIFVVYMILMIKSEYKKQNIEKPKPNDENKKFNLTLTILFLVLSIAAIVVGGNLVNVGAKGVVVKIGVSETLAGLTICAIGTSLPELVTSLIAIKRHENDIAIGNVIGSNIFNIMFILGICGIISPLAIDNFALVDMVILAITFTAFMIFALNSKQIGKSAGIIMILIYVLYFIFIVLREFYQII